MLKKKIPVSVVLILLVLCSASSFFLSGFINKTDEDTSVTNYENQPSCSYNIARLGGYKFINPLMFAEPSCESSALTSVKSDIEELISSYKASGVITSASVYLRKFKNGEWISIGEEKKYSPGSLLKVPELITYFKMNEKNPGMINKKIVYDKILTSAKTPVYVSKSIQLGQSYTIRELLYYMIAYSDNNATLLLNKYIDVPTFKKVFTDLGLKSPDWNANDYGITAKDYSLFMKVLYNGSYLSVEDSEYCTELLSKCNFTDGMVAGLPTNCKIAHKFGEGGYSNSPQLSESGIIFCNNFAYILTVMTNGTEMNKLPGVISNISRTVYEKMSKTNNS